MKEGAWQYLGYAGKSSWYNTDAFYGFDTKVIGEVVIKYSNPPQDTDQHRYNSSSVDQNWENLLLTNRSKIQKGDLVFYGESENKWNHVAIVVGWGLPTEYGPKLNPGSGPSGMEGGIEYLNWIESLQLCNSFTNERPLVVERSGGIAYTAFRSLDNTTSRNNLISIVHVNDN